MAPSMPPMSLASVTMEPADVAHRTSCVPQINSASRRKIITDFREGRVWTGHTAPLARISVKGVSNITQDSKLPPHVHS
jgi:hypothetical protein